MDKTLSMKFTDSQRKKVSISLSEIKEDLTGQEVETLMDVILTKHMIFDFKNPLVAKDSAQIVARTTTEVYKA
ncbi:DUF2922 domain-containing protein [Clostridium sp. MSJ-11]|uniref:DUF2922 domain-containing protein n=1 Tax=Clostridium mobile TaxID=2841512 RepID=A0ABS6EGN1_9CLOT|nr:DUF2922 domain-containing protein [Clostridium mobile]MBU5484334.1 DUF2922 domain-containing protein [Clostridium mobile]